MIENYKNKVFYMDNLKLLKQLPDNSIDLVYIDPPFSTGRDFYTKKNELAYTDKYTIQELIDILIPRIKEIHRTLKPTGHFYLHGDDNYIHNIKVECDKIFGIENFSGDIIWYRYNKIPDKTKKLFFKMHDTILHYTKSNESLFNPIVIKTGEIIKRKKMKKKQGKIINTDDYIEYEKEKLLTRSVIDDIPDINIGNSKEKTGYPTQKSKKLIERILMSSIPKVEGKYKGIILDCFAGSGTTLEVAKELGVDYIGCDNSGIAIKYINERLNKTS